jgi:hypothetical protein
VVRTLHGTQTETDMNGERRKFDLLTANSANKEFPFEDDDAVSDDPPTLVSTFFSRAPPCNQIESIKVITTTAKVRYCNY